jgi:hypothetical protein
MWKLLSAWWWPTIILGAAYIALSDYAYWQQYNLDFIEIIIATLGTLAALGFLKSAWLLMAYTLACRARFKGSLLLMAALVDVLLVVALASVAGVGALHGAEFPRAGLPWLLACAYVFFTLALWIGFTFAHRVFARLV